MGKFKKADIVYKNRKIQDKRFNKVILHEIEPLIAKALFELDAKMRLDSLSYENINEELFFFKVRQMQEELNSFIDLQAKAISKMHGQSAEDLHDIMLNLNKHHMRTL